jgi:Xaa-Pro aminopeptidase
MLIGQQAAKESMQQTSYVKQMRFWKGLPFPVESIKEALEELNLDDGRIGCELGLEERLGISYDDFTRLRSSLPKAEFKNAAEVFWKLRAIKSSAEIECLKKACDVTASAYEKTFWRYKGRYESRRRETIGFSTRT